MRSSPGLPGLSARSICEAMHLPTCPVRSSLFSTAGASAILHFSTLPSCLGDSALTQPSQAQEAMLMEGKIEKSTWTMLQRAQDLTRASSPGKEHLFDKFLINF